MAGTSLASQLKKLQTPQADILRHKIDKSTRLPSFLFKPSEAAQFDRETFYQLGLSGLEELKRLDPNFLPFENSLFDKTSLTFERTIQDSKANEKLNQQIKAFLTLLSPYFLLKPAHKALEWLINRFHIDRFNVDDIMFLILPYHETAHFAQMLQILNIKKDSRWAWLQPVRKESVPLAKTALYNRAGSDMSFLKFVCDMPNQAITVFGSRVGGLKSLFAFYCTTVVGGIEHTKRITELHITHILPSLIAALSSTPVPLDYLSSTFIIIAALTIKVNLSSSLLTVLINNTCKIEEKHGRREAILLLLLLSERTTDPVFPEKGLGRLVEKEWFVELLSHLQAEEGLVVDKLAESLVRGALAGGSLNLSLPRRTFLHSLLTRLKYQHHTPQKLLLCLLESFDVRSEAEIVDWYSQVINVFEHSYAKEFDSVVSEALSNKESKCGEAVKVLLKMDTSRNELFLKLVHPNEDIRIRAVRHIRESLQPHQLGWLEETLRQRLREDSAKVVKEVLRLPDAFFPSSLGSPELVEELISLVGRFTTPTSGQDEEEAATQALVFLTSLRGDHSILFLILALSHIDSVISKLSFLMKSSLFSKSLFFQQLQADLKESGNTGVALWKTLSNADVRPTLQEITSTMDRWPELRRHPVFWSSASLLIASRKGEHLNHEATQTLVRFLTQHLEFLEEKYISQNRKKEKSKENKSEERWIEMNEDAFIKILEGLREGENSCRNILACLHLLTPHGERGGAKGRKAHPSWIQEDSPLLMASQILQRGAVSPLSLIRSSFINARHQFLQKELAEGDEEIELLLEMGLRDPEVTLRRDGLKAALERMKADEGSAILNGLGQQSALVPCLLIFFSSTDLESRMLAVSILRLMANSLAQGFYTPLVQALSNESSSILNDPERIEIIMFELLSPAEEVCSLLKGDIKASAEKILNQLMAILKNTVTPDYVKSPLLSVLQLVTSKDILLELLPISLKYVGSGDELDEHSSNIVVKIFKRFDTSTVEVFKEHTFWTYFEKILSDHGTKIIHHAYPKGICPAALILDQITKKLFAGIPEPTEELKEKLLSLILSKVADVDNIQVVTAFSAFFKRIVVDGSLLVKLLNPMEKIIVPVTPSNTLRARKRESCSGLPSLKTLETPEWKRGLCLLEVIQNKKQITNLHLLLPTFFSLLKKCLQFEEQGPVEYTKQLLLSAILQACEKLQDDSFILKSLQVDVIVGCVRGSDNPQTHHHTLLALAYIAHLLPEQVLDNIMEIFTFIGSSILRQDDAYSFQLISKIIETVIPVLIESQKESGVEEGITNVLRVFVSAIMDVPEHRRIPVFRKLLSTLSNGEFAWIFLCLIFEKHVLQFHEPDVDPGLEEKQKPGMSRVLQYALRLTEEFPPSVVLHTSHKLLSYVSKIPNEKDMKAIENLKDKQLKGIINIKEHSPKNLRHFKFTLLSFLSSLLSSKDFVKQVTDAENNDEGLEPLQHLFRDNIRTCLSFTKALSHAQPLPSALTANQPQTVSKYARTILSLSYDILDKISALLPSGVFVEVVEELLQEKDEDETVRRKALELLAWRLQQGFALPKSKLKRFLPKLEGILDEELERGSNPLTLQAGLLALKLMARHLSSDPETIPYFKQILEKTCLIFKKRAESLEERDEKAVIASLALTIGELVSLLKAHALPFISAYLPPLINILHQQNLTTEPSSRNDFLLMSIVASLNKIVETLAQFLSPYMEKLLYEISILSAKYPALETSEPQQKVQNLPMKLKQIRGKLSRLVEGRVLVKGVSACMKKLLKDKEGDESRLLGIGPLMSVLSGRWSSGGGSTPSLTSQTLDLFLTALEFCSTTYQPGNNEPCPSISNKPVAQVEESVIAAFVTLALTLSESSFSPLYQNLFHWATRASSQNPHRIITFYRLSVRLAERLKSLFPPFVSIFIDNAGEMLKQNNPAIVSPDQLYFQGPHATYSTLLLVEGIVQTFQIAFTYETSHNFLSRKYFEMIMEPLVDQVENKWSPENEWEEKWSSLLIPCIASLATAIGDDTLRKALNHKLLTKTTHSDTKVRMMALRGVVAVGRSLGEGFMPLLPDTLPFLAQLLEDDDPEVERLTQFSINDLQEILGEPIQKYF